MSVTSRTTFKRRLANFFGGLGYLFCSLQWLLVVLVYFSFIKSLLLYVSPTVSHPVVKAPIVASTNGSNSLLWVLGVLITVIVVTLSIYVLVKTPSVIVKTSKKVVHETAETVAPVVLRIQHVENPEHHPKKLKLLTLRLVIILKALLIITPIVLAFVSQFNTQQTIDFSLAMYLSIWLAGLTIVSFVLQYSLARLLAVKHQDIW